MPKILERTGVKITNEVNIQGFFNNLDDLIKRSGFSS